MQLWGMAAGSCESVVCTFDILLVHNTVNHKTFEG